MKTKNDIRKYIKSIFLWKSREELETQDKEIQKKVIEYVRKNNVQHICIYEHVQDEVETWELIKALGKEGKSLYTPQMIWETQMILIDSEYGIYEKEIDLFIIPARAFSESGKRLGRGKWYYDRFLAKKQYKSSIKLGICYDFQILEDIPTEKHDISMHLILSS